MQTGYIPFLLAMSGTFHYLGKHIVKVISTMNQSFAQRVLGFGILSVSAMKTVGD